MIMKIFTNEIYWAASSHITNYLYSHIEHWKKLKVKKGYYDHSYF